MTSLLVVFSLSSATFGGPTVPQKCLSAKYRAAGTKANASMKCLAGKASKATACESKAQATFLKSFTKADAEGACNATASDCECLVDACWNRIRSDVASVADPKCAAKLFEAAGILARSLMICNDKSARSGAPVDALCMSKARDRYTRSANKLVTCAGATTVSDVSADVALSCVQALDGDVTGLSPPVSSICSSGCAPPPVCGNGIIEPGEWCDGDEFCESNCSIRRVACCEFSTPSSDTCSLDVPAFTLFANQAGVCGNRGGTFRLGLIAPTGPACAEPSASYSLPQQAGACVTPPELSSPATICCQDRPTFCSQVTTASEAEITSFVWGCLYENYPYSPVVAGTCGPEGQCLPAH